MSRLSDEILNKYLDGELPETERVKVANQIEFSGQDRKRFLALKSIHQNLKQIKTDEVSAEFTSMLMSKLMKKYRAKKEQKVFIFSISSIFIIVILIILGVVISAIMNSDPAQTSTGSSLSGFFTIIGRFGDIVSESLNGKNLSIIGSVISFGLILSAYFFFESHKQVKRLSKL